MTVLQFLVYRVILWWRWETKSASVARPFCLLHSCCTTLRKHFLSPLIPSAALKALSATLCLFLRLPFPPCLSLSVTILAHLRCSDLFPTGDISLLGLPPHSQILSGKTAQEDEIREGLSGGTCKKVHVLKERRATSKGHKGPFLTVHLTCYPFLLC